LGWGPCLVCVWGGVVDGVDGVEEGLGWQTGCGGPLGCQLAHTRAAMSPRLQHNFVGIPSLTPSNHTRIHTSHQPTRLFLFRDDELLGILAE